ncbi:reverse transcriptase domain-containing protein [Tanacetum coccineum]
MKEGRINGNELKTELKEIRTQIIRLQKKRLGQKDKIAFAHYRISNLEQIIEKIQARYHSYYVLSYVDRMPPKRTSTSQTPAITLDALRQLIADFTTALEAQAAAMANRNTGLRKHPTESVFSRSKCAEEDRVTFATSTLTNDALSWWNAYAQPNGIEKANRITWTELKELLTNKYYPRTEVKKMEDEFYNLVVKGNDLKTYIRRFQELAVLCPNMVPNAEKLVEVFINGLPRSIEGNVTASKPQTLEEAINIAQRLMDQIIKHDSVQEANDRKRKLEDKGNIINNNYQNNYNNNNRNNDHHQQQNKKQETFRTYTAHQWIYWKSSFV